MSFSRPWRRLSVRRALLVSTVTATAAFAVGSASALAAPSGTYQVGPGKQYATVQAAADAAPSGSVIEIAAGTYSGRDALLRLRDNKTLTVRGVGDVVMDAAGQNADGKGIFVIDNGDTTVENITFVNAKVPDNNGAGIRLGDGHLVVRDCTFLHNQMGILTNNLASTSVELYDNEFGFSSNPSLGHNVYIGRIGSLVAEGNYSHDATLGHLFKSRAAVNIIRYNRFTDGTDPATARASYELDLPDGGQAVVVGNIFGQAASDENSHILNFATESSSIWPSNELYVAHNTFLNAKTSTSPVLGAAAGTRVVWENNLLQSNLSLDTTSVVAQSGNATFSSPDQLDASYLPKQALADSLAEVTTAPSALPAALTSRGASLAPAKQYQHPASTQGIAGTALPGAVQEPGSWEPTPVPSPTCTPSPTSTATPTATPTSTPTATAVTTPSSTPISTPTPTPGPHLAATGFPTGPVIVAALVVLAAGATLVLVRRLRPKTSQ